MSNPGENLQPHVLMAIARQIRQLVTAPLQGVRYVPSEQITEILAEVDGPQGTPFEGGTFLVKLVLGSDYPAAPPKGVCSEAAQEGASPPPSPPHPLTHPPPWLTPCPPAHHPPWQATC